jgi:hypothetical protein
MARTRAYISRPMTPDYEDIDAKLEKRLEMVGYECDGSGQGFGMRDLDFTSTARATHDAESSAFWKEISSEIAALAQCDAGDVRMHVFFETEVARG